jgi:hypothetical protein
VSEVSQPASFEVESLRVQDKSLPGYFRKFRPLVLMNDWVPGWQGPEPKGWRFNGATTLHFLPVLSMTFWFYVPDDEPQDLDESQLMDVAEYIWERIGRKSHAPRKGFKSFVFRAVPHCDSMPVPGNN